MAADAMQMKRRFIGPELRSPGPGRLREYDYNTDAPPAGQHRRRSREVGMRVAAISVLVSSAAAMAAGVEDAGRVDPAGLIGAFCPVIWSLPELPQPGELPGGWVLDVRSAGNPDVEEWEIPARISLQADNWTTEGWVDPYAGLMEFDAAFVSSDPGDVDSVQLLAGRAAAEMAGTPGARAWSFPGVLDYVIVPPDSTARTSDIRFWVNRVTDSTLEIGYVACAFYGEDPYSLASIPEDDRFGRLSRLDLRMLAEGRLLVIIEEDGLYGWAGEGELSLSSRIPEGAEIDPLQSMVEITVREVHDDQGDPLTAPAVGHFLVQPVGGEAMMMDRLTGEYVTIRD
jgi:hypothetical protein